MKKFLIFLTLISFFKLHTQSVASKAKKNQNIQQVGRCLSGLGIVMIAQSINMPLFPLYFGDVPAIYPIGVGLLLTGSVMILVSHRKKDKQSVWSDVDCAASENHGNEVRQQSFKNYSNLMNEFEKNGNSVYLDQNAGRLAE